MRDITQQIVDENKNWLPVGTPVRVRETGKEGVVANVLPDAFGAPWSIHVRLKGEAHDAPPIVLGPHEIERLDLN